MAVRWKAWVGGRLLVVGVWRRIARVCGCVNGGCEGEAVPDYQADNTRRAPAPLGSRPRFLGGRLFAGMTETKEQRE